MFPTSASSWSYKPHSDRLVSVPEARGRKVRPNLLSAVFYNVLGLDSGWRRFLSCHSCSHEQNSSNGGQKSFHVAPCLICECNELEDSVFRHRLKKKTPAEGHTAGVTQRIRRTASWGPGGPSKVCVSWQMVSFPCKPSWFSCQSRLPFWS
jgi:hypothetical protein